MVWSSIKSSERQKKSIIIQCRVLVIWNILNAHFFNGFSHCAVGKLNINKTVCGTDPATLGLSIKL